MLAYQIYQSPIGTIQLTSAGNYLDSLQFIDQDNLVDVTNYQRQATPAIQLGMTWLDDYFTEKRPAVNQVPIRLSGTAFQQAVLEVLATVPYGHTVSYKDISDKIQAGQAVVKNKSRAVGGALNRNRLLLLLPCHRVVASDGNLTGFGAGIDRKRWLLDFEQGNKCYNI